MQWNWTSAKSVIFFVFFVAGAAHAGIKDELDRLHQIYRFPEFRARSSCAMISSYDRTGGNNDGFSGKYSYIRKEDENRFVLAELEGPGVIERIWTPTPTDDRIEFTFDGEDKPRLRLRFRDLFSGKVFPFRSPIVGHEVGGYYCYLPIPYEKSCKIVYVAEKEKPLFHQIQYRRLPEGETTTSFPTEWNAEEKEALDEACMLWDLQGKDLSESAMIPSDDFSWKKTVKGISLAAGESATIFEIDRGGRIGAIRISPASVFEGDRKDIILKVFWDGESAPAINCPVADFFGYAFGERAMRSLLLGTSGGQNYCYLPMPFDRSARIELVHEPSEESRPGALPPYMEAEVLFQSEPRRSNEGKLYVIRNYENDPPIGEPYTILDVEGARGHYAGCILQARGLKEGMTIFFEGDDVTTVDGEMRMHGTGSEDFFNGGWYALPDRWDRGHSLPLHGCLTYSIPMARTGGYRFNLSDKVSFEDSFNLTIEHGGDANQIHVEYASVAFYYADRPPRANPNPTPDSRIVHHGRELEYWLQILPILAISKKASVEYHEWYNAALDRPHDWEKNQDLFTLTPLESDDKDKIEAMMKIQIDVPAGGQYEVFITYLKGPDQGTFNVKRRQEPLSETIDAWAEDKQMEYRRRLGSVRLDKGANSLSFWIDGKNEKARGARLSLHRINLKRK